MTLEYPELGASIEHPGFFARSSNDGIRLRGRAPRIGEHNAELFASLGVSETALAGLASEGVV